MLSWRNSENYNNTGGNGNNRGHGGRGRTRLSQGRGASTRNTGNRRLETIASVSRSSGVEKGGDALKDFRTQEEYRDFIQEKLDLFWKRSDLTEQQNREIQENLLILFRKLREGIVASQRNDAFMNEVYETSLCLATLSDNSRQLDSILSYFLQHSSETNDKISPQQSCSLYAIIIALLNQLVLSYPSQTSYRKSIQSIPSSLLQPSSKSHRWITNLSLSLWSNNFCRFDKLTRQPFLDSVFSELLPDLLSAEFTSLSISSRPIKADRDLVRNAFHHAVDRLRVRVRNSAWTIIRSSYRELSCNAESETREWLIRSLALDASPQDSCSLDTWLAEKRVAGHIRPKEGIDGRWIIHR
ncbi:hypothetical protein F5890DRAFT_1551900 [Lentinula detonsa]|uniref:Uncharacterized protein n=1 Tax=Lentinula detonsa TaxID=2804962 RepID=A0AA38Q3D2_9AGAR|nr:hypothetical protein F5890DRAFT_1551900 [Lentinula detonsa]